MAFEWVTIPSKLFRIMLVGIGRSGLPTDRFVSTFYASSGVERTTDAVGTIWAAALTNFLSVNTGTGGLVVGRYLSKSLDGYEIRVYDLADPEPRVPYTAQLFDRTAWQGVSGTTDMELPREVACVLSFHNGGPGPRNRGRVYLGPLGVNAMQEQTEGGVRVRPDFADTIAVAAAELIADTGGANDCPWHQVSTVNQQSFPVVGGWVDDACDTIRSRGLEPASRVTWGGAIASGQGGAPGGA